MYYFIQNIREGTSIMDSVFYGYKINLNTAIQVLGEVFSFETNNSMIFVILFSGLMLIAAFLTKSTWKIYLLLTSIMIQLPSFSWIYTLVFISIPLLFYLDDTDQRPVIEQIAVSVFFAAIFVLLPVFSRNSFHAIDGKGFPLDWLTVIETIALILLDCTVLFDTFYNHFRNQALRQKAE